MDSTLDYLLTIGSSNSLAYGEIGSGPQIPSVFLNPIRMLN